MRRNLRLLFLAFIFLLLAGCSSFDIQNARLLCMILSLLIASGISCLLFKKQVGRYLSSVILFIALMFVTNTYLFPYYWAATLDSELQKFHPIYRILSTYFPKEYLEFIEQNKKDIIKKRELKNVISASMPLTNYATKQSIPLASSKAIFNYLKIIYEIEKALNSNDPILLLIFENPNRVPRKYTIALNDSGVSENDVTQLLQAKANIIQSAAENKVKATDQFSDIQRKNAVENLKQIVASLNQKYGDEVVNDTLASTTPFKNPAESAQVIITFYALIIAMGQDEGAIILKTLSERKK